MSTKPTATEIENAPEILPAKANKMFPPWQNVTTVFLRYKAAVPCVSCGKKSRHHWSCLLAFRVAMAGPGDFVLTNKPEILEPLAPVCRDHMLAPLITSQVAELIDYALDISAQIAAAKKKGN